MTATGSYAVLSLVSILNTLAIGAAVLAGAVISGIVYGRTHHPGARILLIGFVLLLFVRLCGSTITMALPSVWVSQSFGTLDTMSIAFGINSIIQTFLQLIAFGLIFWGLVKLSMPGVNP